MPRLQIGGAAAAAREVAEEAVELWVRDTYIATLPHELPIDVFEPLLELDETVSLLLQAVYQAYTRSGQESQQAVQLLLDVLVSQPRLPSTTVQAIAASARRLLGPEGYDRLVQLRPGLPTLVEMTTTVVGHYGVGLGESWRRAVSSGSGGTSSNATSPSTTGETSATSTAGPDTPTTLESVASSS